MEIPYDKWLHFLVIAMPMLWALVLAKTKKQILFAFVLCVVIAGGKELFYDLYLGLGHPEWLDFLASMIAPVVILIISLIIKRK